jgi:hypothetical protein
METIGLARQTLFADLVQRCADAEFDREYPENGQFLNRDRKGRSYIYYQSYDKTNGQRQKYVGPADDPEIARRVQDFGSRKADFRERRSVVTALRASGLPAPPPLVGDVVEALGRAGIFRLRGVLVGTTAYQCYAGMLAVRLPAANLQTGDIDFAQFHAVSINVGDGLPPMLETLRAVEPSFREVPHSSDSRRTTAFITEGADRLRVEFLTPNRGRAELEGKPSAMPALGGAAAQPLRFLDFLIHRAGVAVMVPAPGRYAVHKMIVATRRRTIGGDRTKIEKDIHQAGSLIEAMSARHHHDLVDAWIEARERGRSWRDALANGLAMLPGDNRAAFADAAARACRDLDVDVGQLGITPPGA